MRVLQFSPRNLRPLNNGAKQREYYQAVHLARHFRLTYLGFADSPEAQSESVSWDRSLVPGCEEIRIVPKDPAYTVSKLLRGAFGRAPVTVLNYTTPRMGAELARLLAARDFATVQVEGVHLARYLPILRAARSRPKLVCDWHNIESELMRRFAGHAPTLSRRWYANWTARRIEAAERTLLESCDAHLVCSARERARLAELCPAANIQVIPNGVDVAYFAAADPDAGPVARHRLLFVGTMDYHANVDGVRHFALGFWPALRERHPKLVFTIAGRSPAPSVRELAKLPGIEVTGTIEDVRPWYREAVAVVVPLRIGSGTRLKILEAMAAGVPVISTRLGAEGLDVTSGRDILLADTEQEFAEALAALASDLVTWIRLARGGRELVAAFDWERIGEEVAAVHRGLADTARVAAAR